MWILILLISAGKEKPTKKDEESIPEIMKMTSDMTLHWSESEEDLEVNSLSSLVIGAIHYARSNFCRL